MLIVLEHRYFYEQISPMRCDGGRVMSIDWDFDDGISIVTFCPLNP